MSSTSPQSFSTPSVSLKVAGSSIKWLNKWKIFSLQDDDNKLFKILFISTSITALSIGTYILTKRFLLIKNDDNKEQLRLNGNVKFNHSNNNFNKSFGSSSYESINSLSKLPESQSSSSSTLIDCAQNQVQQHSHSQIVEENTDGLGSSKLMSCVNCSTRTRRLSWRSTSSLANKSGITLTPNQIIAISSDSLSSTIDLCENIQDRLKSGGDTGQIALLSRLNQVLDKLKEALNELDTLKIESSAISPIEDQDDDEITGDSSSIVSGSTLTYYWDVEPNLHFFKLYQKSLEQVDQITPPRLNRSSQLGCESEDEFRAKVDCLRQAFNKIFQSEENQTLFINMGKEILEILIRHSLRVTTCDPTECLSAYTSFINYVSDVENHEQVEKEISFRKISCLSFYDIVLDYIILESLDDLENPPAAVSSVANNRWLSANFRELALQTAVSAVMRHKRTKLLSPDGFFAHFYAILDHISPILAWGFLGTDQDLKLKCLLVKESLIEVIRDYFSFDRVRYTSLNDLCQDILRVTKERYWELNNKLSILNT